MQSYEHGGKYKQYENDDDFYVNEERFTAIYQMNKKVEKDLDNDDMRLCNHVPKEEIMAELSGESFERFN